MALQYCADFCHTTMWIGHKYTYVSSFLNLPPNPPLSSFQVAIECLVELPASYSKFPLPICFTYGNVYASLLLSQFVSPSPSQAGSSCLLCRHQGTHFCYFFYSGTWSCKKFPKGENSIMYPLSHYSWQLKVAQRKTVQRKDNRAIKTAVGYHFTPVKMAIRKSLQITNAGEDTEKREPLYTDGGNANWCSPLKAICRFLKK